MIYLPPLDVNYLGGTPHATQLAENPLVRRCSLLGFFVGFPFRFFRTHRFWLLFSADLSGETYDGLSYANLGHRARLQPNRAKKNGTILVFKLWLASD